MPVRLAFLVVVLGVWLRAADYGSLPLAFEALPGGGAGGYSARAAGFAVVVTPAGVEFQLKGASVSMGLGGGGSVVAENPLPGRSNYLVGTASQWRTGVRQYGRVRVAGILPHVDLTVYGTNRQFEYDLILHPGADPRSLSLRFAGGEPARVTAEGELRIETSAGPIVHRRPRAMQGGRRIDARYVLRQAGEILIELGDYDHSRDLTIDPVIAYSTYLGGAVYDSPNAIAVDAAGNTYIAGATSSFNFPATIGALRTAFPPTASTVAFVAKLNAAGTALLYATYLGGSGANAGDSANGIAIDSAGNAYVTGSTGSADFPTTAGAFSTSLNGATDAFAAKLNASGTGLVYSTYYGGAGVETGAAIAVDSSGAAYFTGSTGSVNLPVTSGALQGALRSAVYSGNDAFAAKLNPLGTALVYSTYLGGTLEDDAYAIAVDATGNAYIAGSTASPNFPVTGAAFQKSLSGPGVGFVAKINPTGTGLGYATFLGGTGGDYPSSLAIDATGDAYVAGTTFSPDFPTSPGAFRATVPGAIASGHAFLSKLDPNGAALVYSTYLGGSVADTTTGLVLDSSGNAILTGSTYSANFPVSANSLNPVAGYAPAAYLAKFNATGTALLYSTLLGASGASFGQAIALDSANRAYVAGYTASPNFPVTAGAFETGNGSLSGLTATGFVTKIDLASATVCSFSLSTQNLSVPLVGGSVFAAVTAPAGCAWEANTAAPWLTLNAPTHGIGPGTVSFTASTNAGSLVGRAASVAVGGLPLTVAQSAGACSSPQFTPASQSFGASGGTGVVTILMPPSCSFTAISGVGWIVVGLGSSGSGAAVVEFTVAPDTGASRAAALTIAGVAYPVSQVNSACTYTLTYPNGLALLPAGGNLSVTLTTGSSCTWNAASNSSWITVLTPSGMGSGAVMLQAGANSSGSGRSADITISP